MVGLRKTELIRRRSSRSSVGRGAGPSAVAAAAQQAALMAVVYPPGTVATQPICVVGPSGRQYQMAIPVGAQPGQQFHIMLPS